MSVSHRRFSHNEGDDWPRSIGHGCNTPCGMADKSRDLLFHVLVNEDEILAKPGQRGCGKALFTTETTRSPGVAEKCASREIISSPWRSTAAAMSSSKDDVLSPLSRKPAAISAWSAAGPASNGRMGEKAVAASITPVFALVPTPYGNSAADIDVVESREDSGSNWIAPGSSLTRSIR